MEAKLAEIEARNARVEADKAWEVSFLRRFCVALLTYICATAWLYTIGGPTPYIHATVPVLGYMISTFSLPIIKTAWLKQRAKKNG